MPTHVPVCVLGNYRDMGEHRVILPDDVRDLIDSLDRWVPSGSLLRRPGKRAWGHGAEGDPWDGGRVGPLCKGNGD